MSDTDPRLQQILNQLKHFGFDFYGYGENGVPLVKGPNQQITDINVAIQFVNKQIEQQNSQSSGSLESGPQLNQNMDAASSPERSVETQLEKPKEILDEKQESGANAPAEPQYQVKQTAPKINLKKSKNILYGDGFDPKTFDPTNIRSALNFIEKSSKKHKTNSDKWLATLFEKFVREQKLGLKQV